MTGYRIKCLVGAAALLIVSAGCQREALDVKSGEACGEEIVKTVKASLAPSDVVNAVYGERWATKTALYNGYDTAGVTLPMREGEFHPVVWTAGDIVYDYAQSGVYMKYVLTADDILPPSGSYRDLEARVQVLYRVGDTWLTCYVKGPKIGNHIGRRTQTGFTLANGIPNEQTGKFEDYHICLAQEHPDNEDFVFNDMQAYIRFEVTESTPGVRNGKLLDYPVVKIVLSSLTPREKIAGDLELLNDGGWRTSLVDRDNPQDTIITVIPEGGQFKPTSTGFKGHYFVAVPARRYADGIRFNLYTTDTSAGETTPTRKAYVDVPGTTIARNQIFNIHDLLKYCALLVTGLSFDYGDDTEVEKPEKGIEMAVGHSGKIAVKYTPEAATDKSLKWDIVSGSDYVSLAQDGTVTAKAVGIAVVKATAKDGGNASQQVKVTVKPAASLDGGTYGHPDFSW